MDFFASYVKIDQHFEDNISIIEHRDEYQARVREIREDIDF